MNCSATTKNLNTIDALTEKKFCIKLYYQLPSNLLSYKILTKQSGREMTDLDYDNAPPINQLDELVKSIGTGVEWVGSCGDTTTWEVNEVAVIKLLSKIGHFNAADDGNFFIIHSEIYDA